MGYRGQKTGRRHEWGKPMPKGEYSLSMSVWILHRQGELLISKRAPGKTAPGCGKQREAAPSPAKTVWRRPCEGSGKNLALRPENGRVFTKYAYSHSSGGGSRLYRRLGFSARVRPIADGGGLRRYVSGSGGYQADNPERAVHRVYRTRRNYGTPYPHGGAGQIPSSAGETFLRPRAGPRYLNTKIQARPGKD